MMNLLKSLCLLGTVVAAALCSIFTSGEASALWFIGAGVWFVVFVVDSALSGGLKIMVGATHAVIPEQLKREIETMINQAKEKDSGNGV